MYWPSEEEFIGYVQFFKMTRKDIQELMGSKSIKVHFLRIK